MGTTLENCSFCAKHKDRVAKLIVSHDAAICNECVDLCEGLLKEASLNKKSKKDLTQSVDPHEIKSYLDQHIIGQDSAKIVLSVAIANHYKRINSKTNQQLEIQKANILMLGPSGTGKTLLAKTVAKFLDVPFVIADATTLTEAGYVGDDVETLIARLYTSAGNNIEKCQRGIVFLDEVDKIARKSESSTVSRDVSGEGVQQALLKLVEGTVCKIPMSNAKKSMAAELVDIDTTNILFIAGGAFVGLEDLIKVRTRGTSIGFHAGVEKTENHHDVVSDDLIRYGLIPEFVGRFPTVITLEKLTKDQLIKILVDVKNNFVDQYKWLFNQDGVVLEFNSESIELIVERTIQTKTGARGLHSELERVLMPHMYNLPKYKKHNILKVVIDKTQVNNPTTLIQENQ